MMETEISRMNLPDMTVADRLICIRFLFSLPGEQWIHLTTLPDFVFSYIYEVGAMQDLPWIRWQDDDLGSSIRRIRITESSNAVGLMLVDSLLFDKEPELNEIRYFVTREVIGLDMFENKLLDIARRKSFNRKNIF